MSKALLPSWSSRFYFAYSESNASEQSSMDVEGIGDSSGSPTKIGLGVICLPLPPIIGGPMFTFACIVCGLIVASTIFAVFAPSGPEDSLSDIARQMETMHRSRPHDGSFDIARVESEREVRASRSN